MQEPTAWWLSKAFQSLQRLSYLTGHTLLQQQAKRQGSPWRSPGPRATSPGAKALTPTASSRVARPLGYDTQLLEPEDHLVRESPSSTRHSSSAHPSRRGDISSEQQAAPKEADDPSSRSQPGTEGVLGSEEASPHKLQSGSGRQGKELSSYPLQFGQKADTLKQLTGREQADTSRRSSSAKVSCCVDDVLAACGRWPAYKECCVMGTTGLAKPVGGLSIDITPPSVPCCVHEDCIMNWIYLYWQSQQSTVLYGQGCCTDISMMCTCTNSTFSSRRRCLTPPHIFFTRRLPPAHDSTPLHAACRRTYAVTAALRRRPCSP